MKKVFTLIFIVIIFAFASLDAKKITIVHVNDTHSALMPGGERTPDLKGTMGGISRFSAFVNKTRETDTATIVLHAGDFSIGDIMYCNFLGVGELALMNYIGVNAITLGNHEFDLEPEMLTFVLNNGLSDSKIKILCANGNFDETPDLKNFINDYTIIEANGLKVGVFGVTTPNTAMLSQPDPVTFLNDDELGVKIFTVVSSLQEQKCDVIIMLSHLGYLMDNAVAQSVDGIDAIIGGHDHFIKNDDIPKSNDKTCKIVQAGAYYSHAGKLEIEVLDGKTTIGYTLNELNLEDETDPMLDAILESMVEEVESKYGPVYSEEIAVATDTFDEVCEDLLIPGFKDTHVANLVCDAYKEFGGTDIGITASGFTANPIYKGPIVGADIYRAIGYGFNAENTLGYKLVKFGIKGSDILTGLYFGMQAIVMTDDYIIQCSDNMRYKYTAVDGPDGYPIGVLDWVTINSEPLDPDKIYTVTANLGIAMFLGQLEIMPIDMTYFENDVTEYMVVYDYVKKKKTISPLIKRRINDVDTDKKLHYSINTKAFPNPANATTVLEFEAEKDGMYTTYIYDMSGKPIFHSSSEYYNIGINSFNVDISTVATGTYTYLITNGTHRYIGRLAIQR